MIIETSGILRVLKPSDELWLYNEKNKIFSHKVYLGVEDDGSGWIEVTSEEKTRLELLWSEGVLSDDEATNEDLYNALAELGVE